MASLVALPPKSRLLILIRNTQTTSYFVIRTIVVCSEGTLPPYTQGSDFNDFEINIANFALKLRYDFGIRFVVSRSCRKTNQITLKVFFFFRGSSFMILLYGQYVCVKRHTLRIIVYGNSLFFISQSAEGIAQEIIKPPSPSPGTYISRKINRSQFNTSILLLIGHAEQETTINVDDG